MSDLGIALCWIGAFVVFIAFDVWAYFYGKKREKEQEERLKEFMDMVNKQKAELIEKGVLDENGNPINTEDKEKRN